MPPAQPPAEVSQLQQSTGAEGDPMPSGMQGKAGGMLGNACTQLTCHAGTCGLLWEERRSAGTNTKEERREKKTQVLGAYVRLY